MKASIHYQGNHYNIDFEKAIDISLPLQNKADAASAWYCPPTDISPVMTEHFIGDVNKGGAVNFRNISFNPHGNGTHTECVGHISKEAFSINQLLKQYFFKAQVLSLLPEQIGDDRIITFQQIKTHFNTHQGIQALAIRTLPNSIDKKQTQYTNSNPPFIEAEAMNWLYEQGLRHFLIDTPSVDKELDEGKLAAHHAFWNYPTEPRLDATITELIYIPNQVADGHYFINFLIAAIENDAAPSKPTLYEIL